MRKKHTHTHQLMVVMTVRPSRSWYRMFGQPHQVGAVVRGGAPDLCEPVPEGDRFSHKLEAQSPLVDSNGVKPLYNEIGYVELSWSKWNSSHSNSPLSPLGQSGSKWSRVKAWRIKLVDGWQDVSRYTKAVYLQYSQALAKAGTTLVNAPVSCSTSWSSHLTDSYSSHLAHHSF